MCIRDRGIRAVVAGNALAFLGCLPLALPVGGGAADWLLVGYLGAVQIGLAYLLLVRGLARVRAFEASLLMLVEPALNPLWAWLAQGEVPRAGALAGGALILGATVAKNLAEPRAGPGADP